MGAYINIGNGGFKRALNSEYVDKTGLIAEINATLFTRNAFTCVSRCRRFGKSMAAEMLCAYYDRSCDSRALFKGLEIENHPSFEKHLNKYSVIYVDMTDFITVYGRDENIVEQIQSILIKDIKKAYPQIEFEDSSNLMDVLFEIADSTGESFFMIIDEWDAICREFKPHSKAMDDYVNLLRLMFKSEKGQRTFAGVYMTGILPIKKQNTQSALNNFWEYSMTQPRRLAKYFGFTKAEVKMLCEKHDMPLEDLEKWYDGYSIGDEPSMFNPSSVMKAIDCGKCENYWATTGYFDAITPYIKLDYEGLKSDISSMVAGASCKVDVVDFANDPAQINDKEDVLNYLIHLGYLAYNERDESCHVPNYEVAGELRRAVKKCEYTEVMRAIKASDQLLDDLLYKDAEAVARGIEAVHQETSSLWDYNNEKSLTCVINLAFYTARDKYRIIREFPTGRGFADLVFIPWRNVVSPAIVVELKWNQSAETAIKQIHEKKYPDSLKNWSGEILLCGVNYDKETKQHTCVLETLNASTI